LRSARSRHKHLPFLNEVAYDLEFYRRKTFSVRSSSTTRDDNFSALEKIRKIRLEAYL
jgi:hypothetical protein